MQIFWHGPTAGTTACGKGFSVVYFLGQAGDDEVNQLLQLVPSF